MEMLHRHIPSCWSGVCACLGLTVECLHTPRCRCNCACANRRHAELYERAPFAQANRLEGGGQP